MAVMVVIAVLVGFHVEDSVNGTRRAALGAIEGELPTPRAESSHPAILGYQQNRHEGQCR